MLMKLRWVFNPVLVKKIIIILLAILIASITTSFSFGIRKAHGSEAENLIAKQKATDLEDLKAIISDVTKLLNGESVDKEVLNARLESYRKRDSSLASSLERAMELVSSDLSVEPRKRDLTGYLEKFVEKRKELEKSVGTSLGTTVATCEKADKLEKEVIELKEIVKALREEAAEKEEKAEKKQEKSEALIIELAARSEIASDLVNAAPEQLLQRYNVERVKAVALLQERASVKAALEELDDRIEKLEAKDEKSEKDNEKLEKYKEKREDFSKRKFDLEKGFLRSKIIVEAIEKKLKETVAAASVVQTGRGVRIDPQTGMPIQGQEVMQPQAASLGNPRDDAIRAAILGLYNNGQVQGAIPNSSVPTIQGQASPAPAPMPMGGGTAGRGSRGISAGRPQDNSLRALVDYANANGR